MFTSFNFFFTIPAHLYGFFLFCRLPALQHPPVYRFSFFLLHATVFLSLGFSFFFFVSFRRQSPSLRPYKSYIHAIPGAANGHCHSTVWLVVLNMTSDPALTSLFGDGTGREPHGYNKIPVSNTGEHQRQPGY